MPAVCGFINLLVGAAHPTRLNIAYSSDVMDMTMTSHGVKYLIDGKLATPNKDYIELRTVWIVDNGQVLPRFVTAYPA